MGGVTPPPLIGFLLECTSWRGDVTWTVQFLIPEVNNTTFLIKYIQINVVSYVTLYKYYIWYIILQSVSEDLFEQISELLSKTFRTSVSRTLT